MVENVVSPKSQKARQINYFYENWGAILIKYQRQ